MKKTLISMGMAVMTAIPCFAQGINVPAFEFEVKTGTNYPLNDHSDTCNKLGVSIGLESRWNMKHLPMDIGAELYLGSAIKHDSNGGELCNRTFSIAFISDYQFKRGSNVSPYFGLGLGVARCEHIKRGGGEEGTSPCIIPRVGLKLFRHFCLVIDAYINKKNYSHAGLTVGYSFHK